jgi:hypothetical protein
MGSAGARRSPSATTGNDDAEQDLEDDRWNAKSRRQPEDQGCENETPSTTARLLNVRSGVSSAQGGIDAVGRVADCEPLSDEAREVDSRCNAELAVDLPEMRVDGVPRHEELGGEPTICQALRDEARDTPLPFRQAAPAERRSSFRNRCHASKVAQIAAGSRP